MDQIGIWRIVNVIPKRMPSGTVSIEQDLEEWIEKKPEILQAGLTIVGRQVKLEAGIADLIGLDTQGRWVVIEIKRGQIRRDAIAQALDYASSITDLSGEKLHQIADQYLQTKDSSLSDVVGQVATSEVLELENREVSIAVVGTGEAVGLERMVRFLSEKGQLAISIISFSIFEQPSGEIILARALTETDTVVSEKPLPYKVSVEKILEVAKSQGVGCHFRILHEAATELGLYARPYKHSIMYTPPTNRTRMVFTISAYPTGNQLSLYSYAPVFSEFFDIAESEARDTLGHDGWRSLSEEQATEYANGLRRLLKSYQKPEPV